MGGLFEEGFKAVYLAVGAQSSMKLKIETKMPTASGTASIISAYLTAMNLSRQAKRL